MKISLVLATVGRVVEFSRFVESAIAQTYRDFELVVVDQNPDDRLAAALSLARESGIEVIHLKQMQCGLSSARNAGLELARGQLIAFPDDDCWYEPDTLGYAVSNFSRNPAWDGLVGNWVEVSAANRSEESRRPHLDLAKWRRFRGGDASSIMLFFRRAVFARVGVFDPRLGVGSWFGAGEETDFVIRALTAGFFIARSPDVRIHHAYDSSASSFNHVSWRHLMRRGRGTGALYVKHRLSWYVALRGTLSPPFKALLKLRSPVKAIAMSWGIAHGAFRWWANSRRHSKRHVTTGT